MINRNDLNKILEELKRKAIEGGAKAKSKSVKDMYFGKYLAYKEISEVIWSN